MTHEESGAQFAAAQHLKTVELQAIAIKAKDDEIARLGIVVADQRATIAGVVAPAAPSEQAEPHCKLVPIEPTEAMIYAGIEAYQGKSEDSYRAMIAAAPSQEAQPAAQDDEPTDREALIACLEDDAAKLADANPDDEMAQTMRDAAAMLESDAAQPAAQVAVSEAARDVLAERQRQVEQEGWTSAHDDKYHHCELARAAATYALCSHPDQLMLCGARAWPWKLDWWKRTTYRRDLIKSAALLLAEIERIDRATPATVKTAEGL